MTQGQNAFSAADSALGYLYQVRVALLWSLRRIRAGKDFVVALETLDDVTFEALQATGPKPDELLQAKHHRRAEASLTDASGDLWRSLRIWFEGHANNTIPPGTALYLLTTAAAPKDSAAWFLRSDGERNVDKAVQKLETVTQTSDSKANAPAYQAFTKVSSEARREMLNSVVVLDRAPDILSIDSDLREQVYFSAETKHLDSFLQRLEGWWLRRVIKQLTTVPRTEGILSDEIDAQMAELREQFKQDNLPIDEDLLEFTLDEETHAAHEGYQFVHQLNLIDAGKKRIAAAIRDFYRAFEQRSRWLREDLLLVGDLSRYDRKLVEEWEVVFEAMKDDIGAIAAETEKRKAAREVLKWAERAMFPIRQGVTEPFVVRGSFHLLADEKPPRIGWHPDFHSRLANILTSSECGYSDAASEAETK